MADLRSLRPGIAQPVVAETSRLTGNSELVGGAIRATSSALDSITTNAGSRAEAAREAADAAVLGNHVADVLEEQASFIAGTASKNIDAELQALENEGVTTGTSARPVLEQAHSLARVRERLDKEGRLSDGNELHLLMKQAKIIRARPDLVKEVLDLTNKAVGESREIADRIQEDQLARAAAERAEQRSYMVSKLQEYDLYRPGMTATEMWEEVQQVQVYSMSKRQAADYLLRAEQESKLDTIDFTRDEQELGADTRARVRQSRAVFDSDYLPSLTLELQEEATRLTNSTQPVEQRVASWEQRLAQERANIDSTIKDPTMRAEAQSRLQQLDDANRPLLDGKVESEALQRSRIDATTRSWFNLIGENEDSLPGVIELSREMGPLLDDFMGQQANQIQQQVGRKLAVGLSRNGFLLENTEIEGVETPRRPRQPGDPNDANPYLRDGQRVRDVKPKQVVTTTRSLIDSANSVANAPAGRVGPGLKEAASQSIIESLTNPFTREDPMNIRMTLEGVSANPKLSEAFSGARKQEELRQATFDQTTRFFTLAGATLAKQAGVGDLLEIGEVRQQQDGRLRLVGTSLERLPVRQVQQFNNDLNTAARAWAHVNGHTDYTRAGLELLGEQE